MSQPLHAYSAYDLLVDDAHVDDDDAHSTDEEEADTLARAAPQNDLVTSRTSLAADWAFGVSLSEFVFELFRG